MKRMVCCVLLCLSAWFSNAQQYLLFFTDKGNSTFSLDHPSAFLSQRALERRQRYGIALDSTDLPVSTTYLHQLQDIPGVRVLNSSRWLNAVSVRVSDPAAQEQIRQLPFIKSFQLTGNSIKPNQRQFKQLLGRFNSLHRRVGTYGLQDDYFRYGRSATQVLLHKGSFLHNTGLRGDSMIIGMLDAGFYQYTRLPAFDSVRTAGRVLGTWDFVAGEASVTEDHPHGMQCFSIIAANIPGTFVGTAPAAAFYLFRSEDDASETLIEEHNWVCAAERLDSAGGDLISSSLGYNVFDQDIGNHTYADMNGRKTIAARGAGLAVRKGILVFNSAGNSGNDPWKYLTTPADGDSVLAVGAVNATGVPASFSSYGPSADGQVKPDIASIGVGTIIQGANGSITSGSGTSFSCPNIAGLAACLWQGFRELNNMDILAALRASGTKAEAPDDRVGFGIPNMQKAAGLLLKQYAQADAQVSGCRATISWRSKDMQAMQYIIERKEPGGTSFKPVGSQSGTGLIWSNHTYSFTDLLKGLSGPVQYRVQQVLDTSAADFFAVYIDTVNISAPAYCAADSRYTIIPNPATNPALLLLSFSEALPRLELVLTNNSGQRVWIQKETKPAGFTQIPIPTDKLASGKYYLGIWSGNSLLATLEFLKL